MFWLEMSRVLEHGGGDWGFTLSLWAPSYKNDYYRSIPAYWGTVLRVKQGDQILHLRGSGKSAAFVGFSTAASDGFETEDKPPILGENYQYAERFYRVFLEDYRPFHKGIFLNHVFSTNEKALVDYYESNKQQPKSHKKLIFYNRQAKPLGCQFGAYLTEVDDALASLLLGESYLDNSEEKNILVNDVRTAEQIREVKQRIGQSDFSEMIRENFKRTCCFPDCDVKEKRFLVGAHIARWADKPELRGSRENGLCLCLMHDKAFEIGLFTVDSRYRIVVNRHRCSMLNTDWAEAYLLPYEGKVINPGKIMPSREALEEHWKRCAVEFR